MTNVVRLHGVSIAAPFDLAASAGGGRAEAWEVTVGDELPSDAHESAPFDPVVARIDDDPVFYLLIQHAQDRYTFRFNRFADARIDMIDRRITWHPFPGSETDRLPILTAGTVLAAICQLNGQLVLHASAVAVEGSAVAFVGDSGAGKSTLAAMACLGGADLVTDDVLRVEPHHGGFQCYRGARALRLRSGSRVLSRQRQADSTISPDGRHLYEPDACAAEVLPLRSILLPTLGQVDSRPAIEALAEHEATLALLASPRVHGWSHATAATLFDQVVDLAARVPVRRLLIPEGFHGDEDGVARLAELIRSSV